MLADLGLLRAVLFSVLFCSVYCRRSWECRRSCHWKRIFKTAMTRILFSQVTVYKVEVGSNIISIRTSIADHMWTSLEDNCLMRLATERGETCDSFASFCCFHINANIHIVRSFFCMTYCSWQTILTPFNCRKGCTAVGKCEGWKLSGKYTLFWNCTVQYFRFMTCTLELDLFRLHTFSVKLKAGVTQQYVKECHWNYQCCFDDPTCGLH
jgi:hypothetical protein